MGDSSPGCSFLFIARILSAFYGTLALAVVLGIAMNFSSIEPIRALYWSAVSNGVVAVPVMAMMMLISINKRIMGRIPRLLMGKRPPPQGRHFVVGRIFKPMQRP